MLDRNRFSSGFTIIEVVTVITLSGIAAIVLYTVFNTSFLNFIGLQRDSSQFNTVAHQSQRIATVVRGLTDITVADPDQLKFYAYFAPDDTFVSQVHYTVSGAKPSLLAEVIPLDANPPTGNLISNQKRNYTVIENFKTEASVDTFEYLDSVGAELAQPIADLHTIKGVRINLIQNTNDSAFSSDHVSTLTVSLRNRKTNL